MGRSRQNLLGSGFAPLMAVAMTGTHADGLTATGNNQATALLLSADNNIITTAAASAGVILNPQAGPSDECLVANLGANAVAAYPPVGGTINSLSANTALSIPAGKVAKFVARPAAGAWIAILGA
jgi:hypothetical protein